MVFLFVYREYLTPHFNTFLSILLVVFNYVFHFLFFTNFVILWSAWRFEWSRNITPFTILGKEGKQYLTKKGEYILFIVDMPCHISQAIHNAQYFIIPFLSYCLYILIHGNNEHISFPIILTNSRSTRKMWK